MVDIFGSLAGGFGMVLTFLKYFIYALLFGIPLGLIAVIVIRWLTFKYRAIIIEKRAGGHLAVNVDRARVGKKKGIVKTLFANRKGSMEALPYNYLFPTQKKGIFDLFAPTNTFFVYAYSDDDFNPTDVAEEFGKYQFKPYDGAANYWAQMERKDIHKKYNKDPWWKHPNVALIAATSLWVIIAVLTIVFRDKICG